MKAVTDLDSPYVTLYKEAFSKYIYIYYTYIYSFCDF